MKVEHINGMIIVTTKTQHEIASLFMRIQEFYESPYDNIRGHCFSLDDYMDTYAANTGSFTYTSDWNGFNIPGYMAKRFFTTFHQCLRNKELSLRNRILELLDVPNIYDLHENFYLLGVSEEATGDVLAHEKAHALWYLDNTYKHKMRVQMYLNKKKSTVFYKMNRILLEMGYTDDVLEDEIQAYLVTFSYWHLFKKFGFFAVPWSLIPKMKKVYTEYIMHYGLK